MVGGVGLRRGRRDPEVLAVGDVVDFWRVEERLPPRLLRLRAEMRNPGLAWLEFAVEPTATGSTLRQRAVFYPRGLAGQAYWWSVAPFHALVFPPMIRRIVERAEARRRPVRKNRRRDRLARRPDRPRQRPPTSCSAGPSSSTDSSPASTTGWPSTRSCGPCTRPATSPRRSAG